MHLYKYTTFNWTYQILFELFIIYFITGDFQNTCTHIISAHNPT